LGGTWHDLGRKILRELSVNYAWAVTGIYSEEVGSLNSLGEYYTSRVSIRSMNE